MHRSRRFLLAPLVLVLALFVGACGDDDDDNPVVPPATLELNSPVITPAGTFQHVFATAGTFPYHCTLHAGMTGTVIVDPADPDTTAVVNMTGNSYQPPSLTVRTGARVVWTNSDGVNHTVTSTQ